MNNELNELKPCPFCGEMPIGQDDRYMCSTLGCVMQENTISAKDWNTRPIEDALNARIIELENLVEVQRDDNCHLADMCRERDDRIAELEAENNELTERVSMLDVTGVFQKLGEMRTIELVADLKAERDEAKAMVERLIEAIELGNGVVLMHEPEISSVQKWYAKMATVIAEWREREE